MPKWIEMELGNFIELKRGYDLPKKNRAEGIVPIISSSGASGLHNEAKVGGPGVVTGRYGTIGEVFYSEEDFWPLNTTLYVKDFKGNDPLFVYYFLKTIRFHDYSDKAAVPGINRNHLHKAKIYVPEDPIYQRELAEKLWTIDSKIEFNHQTNQTLEQIAQAIFKSWFIDFEPTLAKIAAKQNGQDPERAAMAAISGKSLEQLDQISPEQQQQLKTTAAMFPDTLVDSELGEIPEGWNVKSLSDQISLTGGGTPKRSENAFWEGEIPWFSVKDIPADGDVFVIDTDEKITELGLQKSSTKLLPEGTTIITARGTVGKLALVGREMCMNQSCYGVNGLEVGPYFTYFNMKQAVETLKRNTHGAVFDTITTKTFDTYLSSCPDEQLSKCYEKVISPLMENIKNYLNQTKTLKSLRDNLLPKLLSGELTVDEVA